MKHQAPSMIDSKNGKNQGHLRKYGELVQGIGGRMSGLIETETSEDAINGIQKLGGT